MKFIKAKTKRKTDILADLKFASENQKLSGFPGRITKRIVAEVTKARKKT